MKILSVVGARPNFMKVAPILAAIKRQNERVSEQSQSIDHILVHTGQHYDKEMSDSFFEDLGLPRPDVFLGVGSGSHAVQTSDIMRKFEGVLLQEKPNIVIVVGDVNSTLGCALVASKISYDCDGGRPLIAHVEAGLRSFDRSMPEEINRILTDHISDFLFVTEETGIENLRREGISRKKIHFVGNTMIDTLLTFRDAANKSTILDRLGLLSDASFRTGQHTLNTQRGVFHYGLVTLHRPSNVDNKEVFTNILQALKAISKRYPIIFPCHPRTRNTIKSFALERDFEFLTLDEQVLGRRGCKGKSSPAIGNSIYVTEPLGYVDFLCLMANARIVLTDSGGIQEETTCLNIPCITLRENTERPITLANGSNVLAGVKTTMIRKAFMRQLVRNRKSVLPKYWDGSAAKRIVRILAKQGM